MIDFGANTGLTSYCELAFKNKRTEKRLKLTVTASSKKPVALPQ